MENIISQKADELNLKLMMVVGVVITIQAFMLKSVIGFLTVGIVLFTIATMYIITKKVQDSAKRAILIPLTMCVGVFIFGMVKNGVSYLILEIAFTVVCCALYFKKKSIIYYSVIINSIILLFQLIPGFSLIGQEENFSAFVMHFCMLIFIQIAIYCNTTWIEEIIYKVVSIQEEGQKTITTVEEAVGVLTNSVKDITAGNEENLVQCEKITEVIHQMKEGATDQKAHISDIDTAMEGVMQQVHITLDVAQKIEGRTNELNEHTLSNLAHLQKANEEMSTARNVMMDANQIVGAFQEKMQEIINVLDSIKSISDQTNLLALNASIEAARAGDAGRGFAVVADEVRGLSTEAKNTTETIAILIGEVQNRIQEVISSVNDGSHKVDEGRKVIEYTLESFKEMQNSFEGIKKDTSHQNELVERIQNLVQAAKENVERTTIITDEYQKTSEEITVLQEIQQNHIFNMTSAIKNVEEQTIELDKIIK